MSALRSTLLVCLCAGIGGNALANSKMVAALVQAGTYDAATKACVSLGEQIFLYHTGQQSLQTAILLQSNGFVVNASHFMDGDVPKADSLQLLSASHGVPGCFPPPDTTVPVKAVYNIGRLAVGRQRDGGVALYPLKLNPDGPDSVQAAFSKANFSTATLLELPQELLNPLIARLLMDGDPPIDVDPSHPNDIYVVVDCKTKDCKSSRDGENWTNHGSGYNSPGSPCDTASKNCDHIQMF